MAMPVDGPASATRSQAEAPPASAPQAISRGLGGGAAPASASKIFLYRSSPKLVSSGLPSIRFEGSRAVVSSFGAEKQGRFEVHVFQRMREGIEAGEEEHACCPWPSYDGSRERKMTAQVMGVPSRASN
jgi:hypothetical protein